jgi:CubicO group peptidase (beta-lactamase class C family)
VKKALYILVMISIAAISCGCYPQSPSPKPLDYWPTQQWRTSAPEQQGVDSAKLAAMLAAIKAQQLNVHSILIVRNGYIVLEAYSDPYTPETRHTVESNTKSIVGTLIGIAIDQGKIKSADDKLIDFFPNRIIDRMDEAKKSIRLRDLLAMTPGLDCQDQTQSANDMYLTRVWVQYLLDLPVTTTPGKQWIYCSGASHLLSAVLQQTSGMDARTYANQYLFAPLGIAAVDENDWGSDPQGVSNGIAGLYLTPRELAKYGLLYLQKGKWEGRPVVSANWVNASTREQAYIGKDEYVGGVDRRFGYLFSIFPDQKYYGYLGMGGQEMFVLPQQNMVVVFNAGLEVGKEGSLLRLVNDYLLSSVSSGAALPEDQAAKIRIDDAVRGFRGIERPATDLPQMASDISAKRFALEENPFGWKDLTFDFQTVPGEAILKMSDNPDFRIGLDGLYRMTEVPKQRPIAMQARWETQDTLRIDYLVVGEITQLNVLVKFEEDGVTLTVQNENFSSQPTIVKGTKSPR